MPVFSQTLLQIRQALASAMEDQLPRSGSGPVSPNTVTGSATTLVITGGEIPSLAAGSLIGAELYTSAGTGSGQYLRITGHTTTGSVATLTFNTATALGTDTIFEIHNRGGRGYTTSQYNQAINDAIDAANRRTWTDLSNISLALERGEGSTTAVGLLRHEYPLPSGFLGIHSVELLRERPIEKHGIGYLNATRALGDASARTRVSQGFQITQQALVAYIAVYMGKVGSPTDNLTCVVETNSSGEPSTTAVTNGTSDTVAGTTVQDRLRFVAFSFTPPMLLLENTTYHLTLRRSGANSGTDYYLLGEDDGNNYADGYMNLYSTEWDTAVTGSDLLFAISPQADWVSLAKPWWGLQEQTTDQLLIRGDSWGEGRVVRVRGGAAIARPSTDGTEVALDPDYVLSAAKYYLNSKRVGQVTAENAQAGAQAAGQRLATVQLPFRPYPSNWTPIR